MEVLTDVVQCLPCQWVDCDMAVGVGCTYVGTGIAVVDTVGMIGELSVAAAVSNSYSSPSTFHSAQ